LNGTSTRTDDRNQQVSKSNFIKKVFINYQSET
jgi:hypothetical protein